VALPINRYFLQHPAMVLGTWSRQDRLYASAAGYSLRAQGDLAAQLAAAIQQLPAGVYTASPPRQHTGSCPSPAAALETHLTEGSFFVTERTALMQIQQGEAVPVTYGSTPLQADGTLLGRRLAALIALRDQARRVLRSQNEGWPEGSGRRPAGHCTASMTASWRPMAPLIRRPCPPRRTAPRSGVCRTSQSRRIGTIGTGHGGVWTR